MKLYQILAALLIVAGVSACEIGPSNVPDPNGGMSPGEAAESE